MYIVLYIDYDRRIHKVCGVFRTTKDAEFFLLVYEDKIHEYCEQMEESGKSTFEEAENTINKSLVEYQMCDVISGKYFIEKIPMHDE